MRLRYPVLVVFFAASFIGCGVPQTLSTTTPKATVKAPSFVNAWAGGNLAVERAQKISAYAFLSAVIQVKEQPRPPVEPSPPVAARELTGVTADSSIDWNCVAVAETGGDFTMHGSSYSSAYGVMNEAVRENAPAEVAARILAGTASPDEQLQMAQSIAARFGIDAWAPGTAARCG